MRVLITNHTLEGRTGTETFVRDLALGLKDRGHEPIVFAPRLGPLAEELRDATIPVVDNLDRIMAVPDLIHGHHRHEAVAAMLHFPEVPALFVVHDWHSWHDEPPHFPQIRRYVAVDDTRRDRLVVEHGIPEARVSVIPNGVDTRRFRPRPPLPDRPRRALVYSSYVTSERQFRALQEACTARGITLEAAGTGLKRPLHAPEALLGGYDLVFGLGRSAMEAMAVGAGVILWGLEGLGGFVTPRRFSFLLARNFGRRTLRPMRKAQLEAALDAWNPADCAEVQALVRTQCSLEGMVDAYVALYQALVSEAQARPVAAQDVLRAAGTYLEACVPRVQVEGLLGRRARRSLRRIQFLVDGLALAFSLGVVATAYRLGALAFGHARAGLTLAIVLGATALVGFSMHLRSILRARAGLLAQRGWARVAGLI